MWPIFNGSDHITESKVVKICTQVGYINSSNMMIYHPQKGYSYGHVTVLKFCFLPWCSASRGFASDSWATCKFLLDSEIKIKQKIRSVEHGICPIAEFTSPYWIVRIVTEYRILFSVHVVMYMYCLNLLSEYWKVTSLLKPLPRYRNF